jgi:lipopolysaccharide biosynthesis protein
VMQRQIDLARAYGLSGFCHYHYWFDGRRLLERPTDMLIAHAELDFPFCLAWANASWSRRWKGSAGRRRMLIRQTYSADPRSWLRHFEYLFTAWSDPRHLRVDGKPIFLIYNPHELPHVKAMFATWRREAERRGLAGIHIVAMQHFPFFARGFLQHFDAVVHSQPGVAMFTPTSHDSLFSSISLQRFLRGLPAGFAEPFRIIRSVLPGRLRFHDYDELWRRILAARQLDGMLERDGKPVYSGAFVDWDNTPRYERTARVVRGASPERFRFWLSQLVDALSTQPPDHRLIFVNAWNEWAEGTYLEPDERHGYGYLEAVRDSVIRKISR